MQRFCEKIVIRIASGERYGAIAAMAIAINLKFFFITLFIKKLNKRYAHVKSFLAMDSQRTGADKLSKRNARYRRQTLFHFDRAPITRGR